MGWSVRSLNLAIKESESIMKVLESVLAMTFKKNGENNLPLNNQTLTVNKI